MAMWPPVRRTIGLLLGSGKVLPPIVGDTQDGPHRLLSTADRGSWRTITTRCWLDALSDAEG
jgi:hypothetical protein